MTKGDPITVAFRRVNGQIRVDGLSAFAYADTIEEAFQQWLAIVRSQHQRRTDALVDLEGIE